VLTPRFQVNGSESRETEDVGYEIVPQQLDEDVTMWDVDDEDQEAPKREFIKSESPIVMACDHALSDTPFQSTV
jgi:hypothetical protein